MRDVDKLSALCGELMTKHAREIIEAVIKGHGHSHDTMEILKNVALSVIMTCADMTDADEKELYRHFTERLKFDFDMLLASRLHEPGHA